MEVTFLTNEDRAESVAVGAEVLGNMLLAMYDKIERLRSQTQTV